MDENSIGKEVVDGAITVHREPGRSSKAISISTAITNTKMDAKDEVCHGDAKALRCGEMERGRRGDARQGIFVASVVASSP